MDKTLQLAKEGKKLCTLGDLIHNTIFVEYLKEKGIRSVESLLEVQEGECVVIRSHGVAPECYEPVSYTHLVNDIFLGGIFKWMKK